MNKILTLSQSENQSSFIERFSTVQEKLLKGTDRPIPPTQYWSYLINLFSEKKIELFVCEQNGVDVGRLMVCDTPIDSGIAFFGMVDYKIEDKSIIADLIESAKKWSSNQGMKTIVGPIDLTVWFGNRFKSGETKESFSWEPTNPVQYVNDFLESGFSLDQDYISYFYDTYKTSFERTKPAYDGALSKGFSFRHIDPNLPGEINKLFELNTKAFKVNYMYEPITREQYEKTIIQWINPEHLKYSFFLLDNNQREIGYVYSYPDKEYQIIKSILMDPEFQGGKFASALVHRALISQEEEGQLEKAAGVMVRKGNVSEHFFNFLGTPSMVHNYNLLKIDL